MQTLPHRCPRSPHPEEALQLALLPLPDRDASDHPVPLPDHDVSNRPGRRIDQDHSLRW